MTPADLLALTAAGCTDSPGLALVCAVLLTFVGVVAGLVIAWQPEPHHDHPEHHDTHGHLPFGSLDDGEPDDAADIEHQADALLQARPRLRLAQMLRDARLSPSYRERDEA